jgi:hypothetical protein
MNAPAPQHHVLTLRAYLDRALALPFEDVAVILEEHDRVVTALRDIRAFSVSPKDQKRAADGLGDL